MKYSMKQIAMHELAHGYVGIKEGFRVTTIEISRQGGQAPMTRDDDPSTENTLNVYLAGHVGAYVAIGKVPTARTFTADSCCKSDRRVVKDLYSDAVFEQMVNDGSLDKKLAELYDELQQASPVLNEAAKVLLKEKRLPGSLAMKLLKGK